MIDRLLVFDLKGKLACWKKFYSNSSSFTYEIPTRTNLVGILASILELNRDSYYEILCFENCKISLQMRSTVRKQFHCMNYFKKPNQRDYTQVRLEVLQPLNVQDELIAYRVYVWIKDKELFDKLISRIKKNNQGYGIYLGQRQFRGYADFVDVVTNIEGKKDCKEVSSIVNLTNVGDEENLICTDSDFSIERMPLNFEFAEKNKDGQVDISKLNANHLNRELLSIGRIAYQKKQSTKILSKEPFKNVLQIECQGEKQVIAFYENELKNEILSHPDKLLSEHLLNVAKQSINIIESKNLKLDIPTKKFSEIVYLIGICHDFGKITTYFQDYIIKRTTPDERLKRHSLISSLFGYHILLKFCETNVLPEKYAIYGALAIKGHHGNLDNVGNLFSLDSTDKHVLREQFKDILGNGNFAIYEELLKQYIPNINLKEIISTIYQEDMDAFWRKLEFKIFKFFGTNGKTEDFLIQELMYSVLIDSDKKDAANLLSQNYDISDLEIKEDAVEKFIEFQQKENPEKFNPKDEETKKLVKLKNKVFNQCVANSKLTSEQKIYSITAPTGIGKTYTSFATALKLKSKIKERTGIDYKINYILPFTTIIDQNYEEFYKILDYSCKDFENRKDDYLLKHHYLAADDIGENSPYLKKMSETNNKHYESKSYFDDLLFIKSWDAKVVVSTYVQLMHTIIGGKNSFMNKFHNIVNSIVILDEVQCISLKYWELMREIVLTLSEKFDVYFIFLTATQPLIFKEQTVPELSDIDVFKDPLMDRVQIIDRSNKEVTIEELYSNFQDEEGNNIQARYIFILNTKRSSFELYNLFKKDKEDNGKYSDYPIFYLSTNLTKNDRDKKLEKIIGKKDKQGRYIIKPLNKFILITTQLVEAGVDISSDVCYRDLAPVDSIIQSAGRVNRFGELRDKKGVLNLVHIKEVKENGRIYYPKYIYDQTVIEWTTESIKEQKLKSSQDFKLLCDNFYNKGYTPDGKTKQHSENLVEAIKQLNFSCVTNPKEFSFIKTYPTHSIFILNEDSKPLLDKYTEAYDTNYPDDDNFRRKGELKKIRTKFNKFTIEISPKDSAKNAYIKCDIKKLGEEFYYIDLTNMDKKDRKKIYSEESGFNLDQDESAEFL